MFFDIFAPLFLVVTLCFIVYCAIQYKVTKENAKLRVYIQIATFVFIFFGVLFYQGMTVVSAVENATNNINGTLAQGLGFLGAALVTGFACIGAGVAVGSAAPAAIGAISENPQNFGKAMIFVVLGEGVAIYGLLMSILIMNKL